MWSPKCQLQFGDAQTDDVVSSRKSRDEMSDVLCIPRSCVVEARCDRSPTPELDPGQRFHGCAAAFDAYDLEDELEEMVMLMV